MVVSPHSFPLPHPARPPFRELFLAYQLPNPGLVFCHDQFISHTEHQALTVTSSQPTACASESSWAPLVASAPAGARNERADAPMPLVMVRVGASTTNQEACTPAEGEARRAAQGRPDTEQATRSPKPFIVMCRPSGRGVLCWD